MRNIIYQENVINEKLSNLSKYIAHVEYLNAKADFCEPEEVTYVDEEITKTYSAFNTLLKELYLLVLNYLENQGSNELLKIFKSELHQILESTEDSIIILEHEDFGQFYTSQDLLNIKKFLMPFEAFDEKTNKNIGLIYLENILSNTSYIIKELQVVPVNEATVYNSVKHVIKSAFPEHIPITESFYKEAKCYKPDILIGSLNTAVEYKYATDEKKLVTTMEQILVDVVGYSNHPVYKIFYAVFYVTPGVCTLKRFDYLWNNLNFPDNWKPIYVIGK
ncbi:MAG: hypothetical protein K2Y30_03225 [Flavobacteriaceae bacterium]|nr:hypothetical protein [Flavobacteriaceae bacterium]